MRPAEYDMTQDELRQNAWADATVVGVWAGFIAAIVLLIAAGVGASITLLVGASTCGIVLFLTVVVTRLCTHIPSPAQQAAMREVAFKGGAIFHRHSIQYGKTRDGMSAPTQ